jgi:hypothetical protein
MSGAAMPAVHADSRIRVEISEVGLSGVGSAVQVKVVNKGRAATRIEYWGVVDIPSGNTISWAAVEDATQLSRESVVPPHDSLALYIPATKLKEILGALGSTKASIRGRVLTSTGRWHLSPSTVEL